MFMLHVTCVDKVGVRKCSFLTIIGNAFLFSLSKLNAVILSYHNQNSSLVSRKELFQVCIIRITGFLCLFLAPFSSELLHAW